MPKFKNTEILKEYKANNANARLYLGIFSCHEISILSLYDVLARCSNLIVWGIYLFSKT